MRTRGEGGDEKLYTMSGAKREHVGGHQNRGRYIHVVELIAENGVG